jgi:hypothetical protein
LTPVGEVVELNVEPDTRTIDQGTSTFLTAIATFENGATKNYTQRVDWTSSKSNVASVSNVDGERGKITGNGPGTATIRVHDPVSGVDSKDSNQNGVITVFGALESIELTPTNPSDTVGEERFFTATGHYDGGTERNLTQSVTYTSSNAAVAIATNEAGRKSRVVAVGPGETTITAKDPATGIVSNEATYTVVAP